MIGGWSRWPRPMKTAGRILAIVGFGPMISTALVGNARQFVSGRKPASCLGMVPGEHSSGGKRGAIGITKRGDRCLRTMLIHGARAAFNASRNRCDPRCIAGRVNGHGAWPPRCCR
jgi:transposase